MSRRGKTRRRSVIALRAITISRHPCCCNPPCRPPSPAIVVLAAGAGLLVGQALGMFTDGIDLRRRCSAEPSRRRPCPRCVMCVSRRGGAMTAVQVRLHSGSDVVVEHEVNDGFFWESPPLSGGSYSCSDLVLCGSCRSHCFSPLVTSSQPIGYPLGTQSHTPE